MDNVELVTKLRLRQPQGKGYAEDYLYRLSVAYRKDTACSFRFRHQVQFGDRVGMCALMSIMLPSAIVSKTVFAVCCASFSRDCGSSEILAELPKTILETLGEFK